MEIFNYIWFSFTLNKQLILLTKKHKDYQRILGHKHKEQFKRKIWEDRWNNNLKRETD